MSNQTFNSTTEIPLHTITTSLVSSFVVGNALKILVLLVCIGEECYQIFWRKNHKTWLIMRMYVLAAQIAMLTTAIQLMSYIVLNSNNMKMTVTDGMVVSESIGLTFLYGYFGMVASNIAWSAIRRKRWAIVIHTFPHLLIYISLLGPALFVASLRENTTITDAISYCFYAYSSSILMSSLIICGTMIYVRNFLNALYVLQTPVISGCGAILVYTAIYTASRIVNTPTPISSFALIIETYSILHILSEVKRCSDSIGDELNNVPIGNATADNITEEIEAPSPQFTVASQTDREDFEHEEAELELDLKLDAGNENTVFDPNSLSNVCEQPMEVK